MRTVDPVKHRAKREHILHEAARLFAARGYDGTTTAAICEAAGMSSGNLFHYFSSKREIFAALVSDDETADRLDLAMGQGEPWAALMAFVDGLASPAAEPLVPALVLEAMLQAHRDPELAELLGRDAAVEQAGLAALLARAIDAGCIPASVDPDEAADWIMAMIGGLYLAAATDESRDAASRLRMLRRSVEAFLRCED